MAHSRAVFSVDTVPNSWSVGTASQLEQAQRIQLPLSLGNVNLPVWSTGGQATAVLLLNHVGFLQYFSQTGAVTLRTLDPSFQDVIGNRETLTFSDIRVVNLMYNCSGMGM